jgi:POT family proton-dependent oligopeptide transporter
MNLFAEKYARREIGTFLTPTGWFQSLNPLFIMLLGIPFSMLWNHLASKGKNPPTPVKMYLGLAQVALGFMALVIGRVRDAAFAGHEGQHDLARARLLLPHDGELCISPVGLSMVTKLAPLRLGR